MHLLLAPEPRTPRSIAATILSVTLHGGLVVLLALSGERVVNTLGALIDQTVHYLYPPPRDIGAPRPGERADALGAESRAWGTGSPQQANGANNASLSARQARSGIEFAPIPLDGESIEPGFGDNAFSAIDVDSIALVDPTSAAPEYPQSLSARHVEGGATLRFVIDSTGFIDMSTVKVMTTTHKLFAQAVVEAMPHMKYRPAKVGARAVRLLVEQAFSFKIQKPKGQIS